jgi:hypothetical protein
MRATHRDDAIPGVSGLDQVKLMRAAQPGDINDRKRCVPRIARAFRPAQ